MLHAQGDGHAGGAQVGPHQDVALLGQLVLELEHGILRVLLAAHAARGLAEDEDEGEAHPRAAC